MVRSDILIFQGGEISLEKHSAIAKKSVNISAIAFIDRVEVTKPTIIKITQRL